MKEKKELMKEGKRLDGRGMGDLRHIVITANPIKNAAGSAYIEWGGNKILAAVYGPREALPKHISDPQRAIIKCRYMMAPFSSLEEHGRVGMNRRAVEISKVTKETFESVVMLEMFPGSEISIMIEVLQGDGGTRAAGITCAAVAMALSGIPMTDLPYAVSAGKIGSDVVLDLNKIEDNYSDADMPIAVNPRNREVTLLQMDGEMTREEIRKAMDMVIEAGKTISRIQREAILAPYQKASEAYG
jgi:exosome complex component RRP41